MEDYSNYSNNYSESSFWDKVKSVTKKAGSNVVYSAILLYRILDMGNISSTTKAYIVGALGYFILPLDAIPDIMIPLGFTDDFAVLSLVLNSVSQHKTLEIEEKAKEDLRQLFNDQQII